MDGISEKTRLEILEQCSVPAVDIVDTLRDVADRNQAFENCSLYVRAADEIERLRKDAERYRWLRDYPLAGRFLGPALHYLEPGSDDFDAAIDAAMLKTHNDN